MIAPILEEKDEDKVASLVGKQPSKRKGSIFEKVLGLGDKSSDEELGKKNDKTKWNKLKWAIVGVAPKKELRRVRVKVVRPRTTIVLASIAASSLILLVALLITVVAVYLDAMDDGNCEEHDGHYIHKFNKYKDGTPKSCRPVGNPWDVFHYAVWSEGISSVEMVEVLSRTTIGVVEVVLTTTIIVLQMSTDKFTGYVSSMFFADKKAMFVIVFIVFSGLYSMFMGFGYDEEYPALRGPKLAFVLSIASILIIIPYFTYLTMFIDADKVLEQIASEGLKSALFCQEGSRAVMHSWFVKRFYSKASLKKIENETFEKKQHECVQAVETLSHFALHALEKENKGLCLACLDALDYMLNEYGNRKHNLLPEGFIITSSCRFSTDFTCLMPEVLEGLQRNKTWLEYKTLKQFQIIFDKAIDDLPDICNRIAMNTRDISEEAALHGDIHVVDLGLKFLNTYLRSSLNRENVRTSSYVVLQYAQLTAFITQRMGALAKKTEKDIHGFSKEEFESRVRDYSESFVYYSKLFSASKMPFVVIAMVHDWGGVCEAAFGTNRRSHDDVLKAYLEICKLTITEPYITACSVLKQMVRLCAFYLTYGAKPCVTQIQGIMKKFPMTYIKDVRQEILHHDDESFWEVADRELNMDFVDNAVVNKLPRILSFLKQ